MFKLTSKHQTSASLSLWFWIPLKGDKHYTVYPKKYAHGFVVLCFVVVMQSFIMNSHEVFIHIHQGCFSGTGAIVRLPQCQWCKPDGYGKISQCITTTKHSKAKTVCIFLGIYCMQCFTVIKHQHAYITYTSVQRYGIITTICKWHLREFDLLFLVVCSIAEWNTVDFIDPSRNQIEWPNTVSIVWDRWDSGEGNVSSGVVTWSELCLAITTLMLLCSVGFR